MLTVSEKVLNTLDISRQYWQEVELDTSVDRAQTAPGYRATWVDGWWWWWFIWIQHWKDMPHFSLRVRQTSFQGFWCQQYCFHEELHKHHNQWYHVAFSRDSNAHSQWESVEQSRHPADSTDKKLNLTSPSIEHRLHRDIEQPESMDGDDDGF